MDYYNTLLAKSLAGNGGGSPSSGGAKLIQVDMDYGFNFGGVISKETDK